MSSKRRHFSAEQKAQVVRRHLPGKEAVSNLADEFQIQSSLIHLWVKQVLEQAERAIDTAVLSSNFCRSRLTVKENSARQ